MTKKERIDKILVDRQITESRNRARSLIMAGKVIVDSQPLDKPGTLVNIEADIRLKGEPLPYVSRGGIKLESALHTFNVLVSDRICLDVGASTGGFTDCLLQHGAKHVFAVDVGYGQLAWKIRQDKRVTAIERMNVRKMPVDLLPQPIDLATIDVSFISLRLVVPAVLEFLKEKGEIVALIKPQFEVGKGKVGKGGVVRDAELQFLTCESLIRFFESLNLKTTPVIPSPILGPKGNREFLVHLKRI